MNIKNKLLCGASALGATILSSLIITGAHAADATTTATAADDTTVSDIVVRAEKRAEKLESVPVAVSAFTAEKRDLLGIQTVQQLSDFTPGLSYYAIADRAYIRGIGRNTTNLATESGVATYYNGVYYGSNATIALSHDSLFIGQTEVDRGPQNTLHGSNSDGGTINYISVRPTHDFYAEARVGAANYGEEYGEAAVSGPLGDNFRFRVGGNYTNESGGYFHNFDGASEGGNLPQGNSGTSYYAEAQLEANIGDHLDAWAMVSTGDYHTNFHTVATVGNYNDYEIPDAALAPGGFFGLCGLPGHGSDVGCAGNQDTIIPGTTVTDKVNASTFPGNNPSNVNLHNFIETSIQSNDQSEDVALATTWTYHFPTMDLQYIGGYQTFNYQLYFGPGIDSGVTQYQVQGATTALGQGTCAAVFGAAALPACEAPLTINPAGNATKFDEFESYFSHELNLSSTDSGPVQWIAGLYWYHENFDQPVSLGCQPNQTQLVNPAVTIGAPAGYVTPANPGGCSVDLDGRLQYDSYAGYGQVTWQISPQWKFEGAARYTDDHKYGIERFRVVEFDDGLGGLLPFVAGNFGAATPGVDITSVSIATGKFAGAGLPFFDAPSGYWVRALNASWGAWTGDATLTWQPDNDTLVYGKYSRGYKTGGFSAGQIAANPETAPEYVDAFALGLKENVGSTLQINGELFYYNYQNDQQPINVALPGLSTTTSEIFNIPAVDTYGLELEGIWRPIDPLTITAEYSYLNSKVSNTHGNCFENTADPLAILPGAKTNGCPAGSGLQNLVGNTLPESPPNKVAINGVYTFTFDTGKLLLSASYIWKDKTYGEIFNNPQTLAPAYSTVNLRAEWQDAKDRYSASVFIDNVFNTIGYDNVTETQLQPGAAFGAPYDVVSGKGLTFPLTVGGEIRVKFR